MIPSAQPNKPKSDSNSNSDDRSHKNMATDDDQLSSELISTAQIEPGFDKLQNFDQDIETSVGTEQEQTTPPQVARSWWQGLSLRTKAVALAIALGTLPVLTIGATAYYFADLQLAKQIKQDKQSRVQALSDEIRYFMFERYGDIQVMANLPILRNPKVQAVTTLQEREVMLNRIAQIYKVYDSIAVFDLNGNVIAQSQGKRLGNHKERKYFQQVLRTGEPVISSPEISKSTGELVIHFAAPIKDAVTDEIIGVVRSRMPVTAIDNLIKRYGNGADEFLVVGPDNKFFVAEKANNLGQEAKALFAKFPQLQAANKPATILDIDRLNKNKHLLAYAPLEAIEGLPELNWSTMITEATAEAFAPQRNLLLTFAIGTAVTSLLVSAIAASIANRATRPLLAATKAVEKLGQGELDTRIAVTGEDEIAMLGSNINLMADQLQNREQALLQNQEAQAEQARFFTNISFFRVRGSQDVDSVFNKALRGARNILNTDRVVIYRFNSDWSGYIAAEAVLPDWPQALADKIEDPCIGQSLIQAYTKGRVVPTNNVFEAGLHPEHLKLMERLKIKASLVTPILKDGQLFGLLIAHHCAAPHAWQQTEINFLRQLGSQLGFILDRVTLLEQQQTEAKRAQTIKDITVQLAQSSQAESIFDTAVQEIRSALKADRVVVYSFNEQWQGTVTAESVASGWSKALGAKIDDPCFAQKYVEPYRQGRVQVTDNIYKAGLSECHIKQLEPFAVKANLIAPILQDGQLFGLLIAHQCSAPRAWQQGEIDLFAQLATQVGFALERAKLLEQQKTAKEQLQKRALELLMEVDPVGRGNLTIRASVTEDEIGTVADSYNSMIDSLRKIVTQVQAAAKQVTATTSSSEGSVKELSAESLRQSEEITAALDQIQEMSNSIRAVAQSAEQAEAAVQQATQTVEAGDAAMNRTVEGIMTIRETVAETSKKVKRLGESSQKISKVVNLIGRFAAQTNLLALKASIEAARAGEEGRGFAVLADEVRALARQSAEATAEIESLVKDIQTETKEVVAAMEAGTEQVVTGTRLVDETRYSLNQITAVSTQIGELVATIASAAVAQSQASEAVTITMSDVAAIASKTSNEASVVSVSFKELLALAQELQASADQFKVT